jgi:hypothetical protein
MLLTASVLVLAQAAAAPPPRPPAPAPAGSLANQCMAVGVFSPQAPPRRVSFSATQILDLHFGALLRSRLDGEHVLNLKVYTPKGHLYQQLDVPFQGGGRKPGVGPGDAVEAASGPRMRRVDGYPNPLPEQDLVPTRTASGRRAYSLSARLPVAGTSIMTSSLYGKWKVVPHLDGSLTPCGRGAVFTITQ